MHLSCGPQSALVGVLPAPHPSTRAGTGREKRQEWKGAWRRQKGCCEGQCRLLLPALCPRPSLDLTRNLFSSLLGVAKVAVGCVVQVSPRPARVGTREAPRGQLLPLGCCPGEKNRGHEDPEDAFHDGLLRSVSSQEFSGCDPSTPLQMSQGPQLTLQL